MSLKACKSALNLYFSIRVQAKQVPQDGAVYNTVGWGKLLFHNNTEHNILFEDNFICVTQEVLGKHRKTTFWNMYWYQGAYLLGGQL